MVTYQISNAPIPQRFDVVHPNLKNECSIVFSMNSVKPYICTECRGAFFYRNFLKRWHVDAVFCSWGCVIDHNDYLNWRFEMERKGYEVNHRIWLATEQGTQYFQMKEKGEI